MPPRATPPPGPRARGFTLLELLVVCALLGSLLLLVPPSLDGYGARGRLDQGASTLASAITSARDTAIFDGHAVLLEYDLEEDRFRFHVSSRQRERTTPAPGTAGTTRPVEAAPPEPEDEWLVGEWHDLPDDVDVTAYSEAAEAWESPRGQSVVVSFTPEGIVRPAHALRVESRSLPKEVRTRTVRVNALTSLSEVLPGEAEMPPKRDPSDFR
jgi:type II secretion system protein H